MTVMLWAALVVPSLYVVQKYANWTGAIAYALIALVIVTFRSRMPLPSSARAQAWLAASMAGVLLAVFLVVYPIANVHVPGRGSDDDDAYNVGVHALVSGQSPYDHTTYLGNSLHMLPGAFVLSMPFVLLGTSAWQNVFWLVLFFAAAAAVSADNARALRLAWLVLACSPTVIYQVATGTGHAANTIYVLLGLLWLVRTDHRDIAAAAWGVALASRANFLLLLPLSFGWLGRKHGWVTALRATAITCATFAALALPLYLRDPAHYGPLEGANRLLRFNEILPHAGEVILAVMAGAALVLSTLRTDLSGLLLSGAIVQAIPVLAGAALSSIYTGRLDVAYLGYGTFAAWFVFMASTLADTRWYKKYGTASPSDAMRPRTVDARSERGSYRNTRTSV